MASYLRLNHLKHNSLRLSHSISHLCLSFLGVDDLDYLIQILSLHETRFFWVLNEHPRFIESKSEEFIPPIANRLSEAGNRERKFSPTQTLMFFVQFCLGCSGQFHLSCSPLSIFR